VRSASRNVIDSGRDGEYERMIDHDKLRELADTLTQDQRRLLREGLAGGADIDPESLTASLKRLDSELLFLKLATESSESSVSRTLAAAPPDAGVPDGGTGDGGTPDGGTTQPPKPKPEPPLTRW
jgi:hypothetical protein